MMKQFFMYPYNWVILLIALVLLIYAIVYLARRSAGGESGNGDIRESTPLDILRERHARGEISGEDFERKKKNLE